VKKIPGGFFNRKSEAQKVMIVHERGAQHPFWLVRSEGPKTVLIVDDEPEQLSLFSELLREIGLRVVTSTSAQAAVAAVRAGTRIDLVITDLKMPGMSGLDFIEVFLSILPDVPVIVLTAQGEIDAYFKAFSLGVFAFINKPVVKRELVGVVKAAIGITKPKPAASEARAGMSSNGAGQELGQPRNVP